MRRLLLCVCCLSGITLKAQLLELPLNRRAEDAQYTKLILIAPVFALRGDSVANPLDLSSARPEDPVVWKKVKVPLMNAAYRSGFTWLFNGAVEDPFSGAFTLALIENPGWTYYPSRIWVDHNHNFDMTDDGLGDTFTLDSGIVISFAGENGYQVYAEHFPVEKFRSLAIMNDQAVRKVQGNRVFLGTGASLREHRLNVVASDWNDGKDSFTLAVKDVNCNGKYDEDFDQVMIGNYRGYLNNLQAVNLSRGTAYLEWNGASYQVKKVDNEGRFLSVFRDTQSRLKYTLNKGDKLPRFKYCSATKPSRHKSIRRLKGKMIFIYIWRDGTDEFFRDSAAWHALGRLGRADFEVLGLNYGASARYVFQYNHYFETQIRQGYSSNRINEILKVERIPYGILIDSRQRILATGLTPGEVAAWLK